MGMSKHRLNLSFDEETWEAKKKVPREVNLSACMRWIVMAIVTPEAKLRRMIQEDEEAQRVRDYLKEKLGKYLLD